MVFSSLLRRPGGDALAPEPLDTTVERTGRLWRIDTCRDAVGVDLPLFEEFCDPVVSVLFSVMAVSRRFLELVDEGGRADGVLLLLRRWLETKSV